MSETIDSKVVEMRFDNAKFEENVQTTMGSLEKLKQSLKFEKTSKGFESIERAARDTDISSLSKAAETVSVKFDAMQVAAVAAISGIVNSAVNAGEQLIKSLSVDNIADGWQKFADKTTSVGTLVAQGFNIGTVTKQLERLNWYTDETSYNFTSMVDNISKFTATGKGLKDSVTAMEGIANWAALSGQNANTASRAMYQLSQAMGAGVMRLEDYKSIQNVSMDTDEFRQKALDAAVALGTLRKNADGTYTSLMAADKAGKVAFTKNQFTTNLTQGKWFTSDVMMKVFKDYSAAVDDIYEYAAEKGITASEAIEELGDKVDTFGLKAFRAAQEARTWTDVIDSVKDAVSTGWMNTFENIFGDYEEAKELWTDLANELYDVFAEGGNARNDLLAEWKQMGGRNVLVETFWDAFHSLIEVINEVKAAFHDIFPEITLQRLIEFTRQLRIATTRFELSGNQLNTLRKAFSGIFAVLGLGIKTIKAVTKGLEPLVTEFANFANSSDNAFVKFGNFMSDIDKNAERMGVFETITKRTANAINTIIGYLKRLVSNNVSDYMLGFSKNGSILEGVLTAVAGNAGNLVRMIFDLISAITGIDLSSTRDNVLTFMAGISSAFVNLVTNVAAVGKRIVQYVSLIFESIVAVISKAYETISSINIGELISGPNGILSGIGAGLSSGIEYITDIFSKGEDVSVIVSEKSETIAANVNKAADKFAPLKNLMDAIKPIGSAFGGVFSGLVGNLKAVVPDAQSLEKIVEAGLTGGLIYALVKFAKAIGDFGGTIKGIAKGQIIKDILGIEDIIKSVKGVFDQTKALIEEYQNKIKTESFMNIATSITLLCMSLYVLSTVPMDDLAKSLLGMGAVFIALMILFKQLTNFVSVVSAMGNKRKIAETAKLVSSTGLSLFEIAGAIFLVSSSIAIMGKLDPDQLSRGFGAMFGIVLTLVGGLKLLQAVQTPHPKAILASAASLAIMATAVDVITPALAVLGVLDPKGLDNAWKAIVRVLSIMTLSVVAMNTVGKEFTGIQNAGKIVAASSSFAVMAAAIDMLIPFFAITSVLPDGGVDKAFAAFCAVLIGMTGAIEVLAHVKGGVTNPGKIVAVTSSMVIMAIAMNAMIPAVTAFASLGWNGAGAIAEIVAILLAMASSMAILDGFDPATMLKGTSAILIFSVALDALIPALVSLGSLNALGLGGGIWMAIGELTAVLGIFMGIFALFDAMNKANILNTVDYVAAAGGIALMALALNALVPPLVILGGINLNEGAWKGIAIAIGEIAAIVGIISLILRSGGKDSLMGGAGLLAAAAGISILVPALIALGGASLSLMAIGPALAAFGAFAAVISKLGPGLLTATPGMLAMAAALAALALALQAMGPALIVLGSGMAMIVAGIVEGTKLLAKHMDEFVKSFGIILAGVTELIIDTVLAVVLGVLRALHNYGPDILKEFAILCTDLIQVLIDNVVPIIGGLIVLLGAAIVELIEAFGRILDPLAQAIVDFIIALINAIANAIGSAENIENFKAAMRNLVEGGLTACLALFGADLDDAKSLAQEFCDDVDAIFSGLYDKVFAKLEDLGSWLYQFSHPFEEAELDDAYNKTGAETDLRDSLKRLPDDVRKEREAYYKQNGLLSDEPSTAGGGRRQNSDPRTWDSGETYDLGVYDGEEYNEGFVDGVHNKIDDVYNASKDVGQSAVNAVEDVLDIHSPSKVLNTIGGFFTQGFALGIAGSGGAAVLAANTVASNAASETVNAIEDNADNTKKAVNDTADKAVEDLPEKAEETGEKASDSLFEGVKNKLDGVKNLFAGFLDPTTLLGSLGTDMSGLSFFNATDDTYISFKEYMQKFGKMQDKMNELTNYRAEAHAEELRELKSEYDDLYDSFSKSTVIPAVLAEADENIRKLTERIEKLEKRGKNVTTAEKAHIDQLRTELAKAVEVREEIWTKLLGGKWEGLVPKELYEEGHEDGTSYGDGFGDGLGGAAKKASEKFWASFKLPDGSIFNYEFSSKDDYVKKGQSIGGFDSVAKAAFEHYNDEDQRNAFQSWNDTALNAQFDSAKEAYDKFFDEFEKGTLSASAYEKKFTALLKKNVPVQERLAEYAAEKMSEYTSDALEDITDDYEKKLEDINDKIDDFIDNIGISWGDVFDVLDLKEYAQNLSGSFSSFFTPLIGNVGDYAENLHLTLESALTSVVEDQNDILDAMREFTDNMHLSMEDALSAAADASDKSAENASSFASSMRKNMSDVFTFKTNADHIEDLNEKLEKTKEKLGEDSNEAKLLARRIDNFTRNTKGKENEIYSVNESEPGEKKKPFGSAITEETEMLKKYAGIIETLKQRGITDDIMEMIAGMGREEGMAAAEYLSKLSEDAYQKFLDDWEEHKLASDDLGHSLYEGTEDTLSDILDSDAIAMAEYVDELDTLLGNGKREVSAAMLDMLKGMGRDEATKAMAYLNALSDAEYKEFLDKLDENEEYALKASQKLYQADAANLDDKFREDAAAFDEYNENLDLLLSRNVSSGVLDMLKGMGRDEANQAMAYLNALSDAEYQKFEKTLKMNERSAEKTSEKIYEADAKTIGERLEKETRELSEYNKELSELMKRDVSTEVTDMIAGLSRQEGLAAIKYLNSLSDTEYRELMDTWSRNRKLSDKAANTVRDAGAAAGFKESLDEDLSMLKKYDSALNELFAKREMPDTLRDYVASLDRESGYALVTELLKMSEEEYSTLLSKWKAKESTERNIGELLYDKDIKEATTEYVNDTAEVLKKLPESALETGKDTMRNLAEGMSLEAQNVVESVGSNVEAVCDRIDQTVDRKVKQIEAKAKRIRKSEKVGSEDLAELRKSSSSKTADSTTSSSSKNNGTRKTLVLMKGSLADAAGSTNVTRTAAAVTRAMSSASAVTKVTNVKPSELRTLGEGIGEAVEASANGVPAKKPVSDGKATVRDSAIERARKTGYWNLTGSANTISKRYGMSMSEVLALAAGKNSPDKAQSAAASASESVETAVNDQNAILTRVEESINNLSGDMTEIMNGFGDSLSNVQVVIDPNAASAKLAVPVANAIGRLVIHKTRGG